MQRHFWPALLGLLISLAASSPAWAQALVFSNAHWTVEVDPSNLAIAVAPTASDVIQVSRGSGAHRVSDLRYDQTKARWQWDEGAWQLRVELQGADLHLQIVARDAGRLTLLDQPAKAMGNGLLLPMAEGRYVASEDRVWRDYLLREHASLNTQQDLSLPLWGMDHGANSLHWLFLQPFGNRVALREEGGSLAMRLQHDFSPLDVAAPMSLLLHLGGADPLAGAKRYRQWLMEQGQFESLAEKMRAAPETAKLPGAIHVYLWGGGLLAMRDVLDWSALRERLQGEGALASALHARLDRDTKALLTRTLAPHERRAVLRALNQALNSQARSAWQNLQPDPDVMVTSYLQLRTALAVEFAGALATDPSGWGGGVSRTTIQRLRESGLPRLWIGLGDSWEPGLWHPETIADGVAAGWLMAPYDSYETALPGQENPDWTTAHLGEDAYQRCAVVLADGERKAGFLGKGHYTAPACMRPLLERRITAIRSAVGFNSWFIDAYATGMLFESYRPGASMTYAEHAAGNVAAARWINRSLKVVVGSEDGNAVTAGGIAYAHGLQTPVMGWDDPDIGHQAGANRASPYYLGNYFPAEQPSVFFKSVPAKPVYRHVHFAAPSRLPLYQAVFHDSVVTSHHWGMDNLKFNNVRVDTELAQLLYNVAPMYHLSEDTLEDRLPHMQRMDAFFRTLHQRLATQALVGFRWRTADRLVQETRFADGTVLIANFSDTLRQVDAAMIPAASVMAFNPDGSTRAYGVMVPSPHQPGGKP